MYTAHKSDDGRIQSVKEHSFETAEYAKADGEKAGLSDTAFLAGILHDMGKNTKESDEYQNLSSEEKNQQKKKVIHSLAGGRYLYEKYSGGSSAERFLSELIGISIFNHHGLYDCVEAFGVEAGKNIFLNKMLNEDYDYSEAKEKTFSDVISEEKTNEYFERSIKEVRQACSRIKAMSNENPSELNFYFGLLERLLTSMLINADHRNTGEFMTGTKKSEIQADENYWSGFFDYFEKELSNFQNDSHIGKIRKEISDKCLEFSDNDSGIYRLNVPTGGGKTLSGFGFALCHAKKKKKSRIFYIAPYNSILEQNSNVIRSVIPDKNALLEHHCNVTEYEENNTDYKYMTENWSAPVVATSMVQFLNSLFFCKVGAIRRMRGLINSVIIIDEVQTVPLKCITLFNMAMNFLSEICGCTVILCSATQPALDTCCEHKILTGTPCDMIDNYKKYAAEFKRTDIDDSTKPYGYTYSELAFFIDEKLEKTKSVLAVFNTKSQAFNVWQNVKNIVDSKPDKEDYILIHLSTNMCARHREIQIDKLRKKLGERKKVICISTQLIEAGVDISFECVVRSIAGLDSIIQAAGRCNRNAEADIGKVYVVNPADENVNKLASIRSGKEETAVLLELYKRKPEALENDIASQKAVNLFYSNYFSKNKSEFDYRLPKSRENKTLYSLLSTNIAAAKRMKKQNYFNQAFRSAGEAFEVISTNAISVLVPYDKGITYIEKISSAQGFVEFEKDIQKYCINIFENKANELIQSGTVYRETKSRIYILKGKYSNEYGYCGEESLTELLDC